jgi:adenylate kinase
MDLAPHPSPLPVASRSLYSSEKVAENVQCEIMQVVAEEAREYYKPEIVHVLPSNNLEDLESNVTRLVTWLDMWRKANPSAE